MTNWDLTSFVGINRIPYGWFTVYAPRWGTLKNVFTLSNSIKIFAILFLWLLLMAILHVARTKMSKKHKKIAKSITVLMSILCLFIFITVLLALDPVGLNLLWPRLAPIIASILVSVIIGIIIFPKNH